MHLMYNLDPSGKRIYTLKKVMDGQVTKSAHPARFSPDDKWSRHRITMRKRFAVLLAARKQGEFGFYFPRRNLPVETILLPARVHAVFS